MRRSLVFTVMGLLIAALPRCYGQDAPAGKKACAQQTAPPAPLSGRVIDNKTKQPVGGVHVFVELCGLYTENADPSKGHPNYRYGAETLADGSFSLNVPAGALGLHAFQAGYRYGPLNVPDRAAPNLEIAMEPFLTADEEPKVAAFSASTLVAAAGTPVTFSADVRTSRPTVDPLSEEVLILEPSTHAAIAMDPPSPGVQGKGFPDGIWKATLNAPKTPGKYVFVLSVSTEQCITNQRLSVEITVP